MDDHDAGEQTDLTTLSPHVTGDDNSIGESDEPWSVSGDTDGLPEGTGGLQVDSRRLLQRKRIIRIAKCLIAVMVAAGLAWAGKSAVNQWQSENQKRLDKIAEVQIAIEHESNDKARAELEEQCEQLQASVASLGNLRWSRILLSALLYAVGIFVPGLVLQAALRSLGESPRMKTAVASQLLGHAGKYVPGKAMVIVLRSGGLSIDGVRPVRATISVFMETLLMMAVGSAVACIVIVWLPVPAWMTWAAVGVAILASVPTLPPILKRVAAKVANTSDTESSADLADTKTAFQKPPLSSFRFFVTGWAWSLVSWLLIGASFTALVTAIPGVSGEAHELTALFPAAMASIALAMVVGFVSLLPGGAGIRELVLTTILATAVGPAHALLSALAARLMFIIVEAVCAAGAWMWLRKQKNEPDS